MERKIQFYIGKRPLINLNWGMRWAIVILVLYFKLFYLVPLPGTFGARVNIILPVLVGDLLFVSLLLIKYDRVKNTGSWRWIKLFMIFQIARVFYTWISYPGEPRINAIKGLFTCTAILTYFVFVKAAENDYKELLNFVIDASSVTATLFLLQAILYRLPENTFLQVYGFSYGDIDIILRNGNIRLIASDIVDFSTVLSIGCIFSRSKLFVRKQRYLLNLLMVFVYEYFVGQTRGSLLIITGTLFITLLFLGTKNILTRIITTSVFILGILVMSQNIIELISDIWELITNRVDYSIYHRIDSYIYYLNIMIQKPLFGIGILATRPVQRQNFILLTGGRSYAFSDVGIAGVGSAMGITGIAFYLFPIFRAWNRFRESGKTDALNFAIFVGMLFSMLSLSLFDAERIIIFALFLAISDLSYQSCFKLYQKA